jgi:hypothetical protein
VSLERSPREAGRRRGDRCGAKCGHPDPGPPRARFGRAAGIAEASVRLGVTLATERQESRRPMQRSTAGRASAFFAPPFRRCADQTRGLLDARTAQARDRLGCCSWRQAAVSPPSDLRDDWSSSGPALWPPLPHCPGEPAVNDRDSSQQPAHTTNLSTVPASLAIRSFLGAQADIEASPWVRRRRALYPTGLARTVQSAALCKAQHLLEGRAVGPTVTLLRRTDARRPVHITLQPCE